MRRESSLDAARTVLVTGGAGFISSTTISASWTTSRRAAGSTSTTTLHDDTTLHVGDVRDEVTLREAMADVDIVFHQAAEVSVDRCIEAPRETHAINVGGRS